MDKDTASIKKLLITLAGDFSGKITLSPRVINYSKFPSVIYKPARHVRYNSATGTTDFTIEELAACEGIMVRVKL